MRGGFEVSHVTTLATEIKLETALANGRSIESDPGWTLLEDAVKIAAEELGGQLTTDIRDYYGRKLRCDWGIVTEGFPRGVGVRVSRSDGEVTFVYDSYGGYETIAEKICEAITQNYTTLAVTEALRSLNYQVNLAEESHPTEGRRFLVKGVL